ncbi:MAG: BNR repeat-containing protein [Tannerella sp.]|jgi:hypothetical protein|nr:BNR repeat-containing protein [Tannerella sp.]
MSKKISLVLVLLPFSFSCFAQEYGMDEVLDVAYVPASFPVEFALLTHSGRQFVAYYDSAKNMTVASRKLDDCRWDYKVLDSKIGWDSHNYVTMKIDSAGFLHVSGNMHASPLVYYRSSKPFDIHSLKRMSKMIGKEEDKVTYPVFMDGPHGEFLYHYRYGGSGNGYEIYNRWDPARQTWCRYLDRPLIDGKGERNAYMRGPVLGPDGYWHLIWVWRETPDCATNHTLSYARSKDLLHWESITGKSVSLPITIEEQDLYVDPAPPGAGLFNPGIRIGFDASGKALIGYHKYDRDMNTQLFVSWYENGKWTNRQVTDWRFQWIFQGRGSVVSELSIDTPRALPDGQIVFGFHRKDVGHKELILDGKTFRLMEERPCTYSYPRSIDKVESAFPEMSVRLSFDSGKAPAEKEFYLLRRETLPANRDVKREGELPPPSMLKLYKITER